MEYKIIQDPVHGSIRVKGLFLDLIQTPELQRLYGIKQLGPTYLVYPGANHTRFEHCLGAFHTAKRMSGALDLDESDKILLMTSGLLHDVGHGPYSHTLEYVYQDILGVDHRDVTSKIIEGKYDIINPKDRENLGSKTIPEILEKAGLDPKEISKLISSHPKGKKYLGQMIHGGIDVDKIDYLLRDAHYTGAVHGVIDLPRLLEVVKVHEERLIVDPKGITSIEQMLMGRTLMYISVYFHKTVRIAENMLGRAVEKVVREIPDFQNMSDSELMEFLLNYGGYVSEIIRMLKYRKLFKRVFSISPRKIREDEEKRLEEIGKKVKSRQEFESELCKKAKIPEGHVIVDIPVNKMGPEPIEVSDIKVLESGNLHELDEYTPMPEFLKRRRIPDWSIMVCSNPKYTEKVKKAVRSLL